MLSPSTPLLLAPRAPPLPPSGPTLDPTFLCHASKAKRSYVRPSDATTGSTMSLDVIGHTKWCGTHWVDDLKWFFKSCRRCCVTHCGSDCFPSSTRDRLRDRVFTRCASVACSLRFRTLDCCCCATAAVEGTPCICLRSTMFERSDVSSKCSRLM